MKIIFSPSKTQSPQAFPSSIQMTEILFPLETEKILGVLKNMNKQDLRSSLKISEKLADKFNTLYSTCSVANPKQQVPALYMFRGTAFRNLSLDSYDLKSLDYAQDKLIILSALYGALRPLDGISEYRLDMLDKIVFNDQTLKNLYGFWQKCINEYFNTNEIILNLASNEYSKMLPKDLNNRVNVEFWIKSNFSEKKVSSVFAKQEKGSLLDFCIKNRVRNVIELFDYKNNGFVFDKAKSTPHKIIYTKNIF